MSGSKSWRKESGVNHLEKIKTKATRTPFDPKWSVHPYYSGGRGHLRGPYRKTILLDSVTEEDIWMAAKSYDHPNI